MTVVSRAEATWTGTLLEGNGEVSAATSRAFASLPVTWSARTVDHGDLTSPEELLAAAHASCFSMQFSSLLAKAGTPAERLDVAADVTFEKLEGGWSVTMSAITVTGRVPGVSAGDFAALAESAKDGCPISRAIKGNVALSVHATLEA